MVLDALRVADLTGKQRWVDWVFSAHEAKGKLMSDRQLSEAEAFRWLRKQAMNSRQRLGDVARAVLEDEWAWEQPLRQGAR